jgi:hypothetical protein
VVINVTEEKLKWGMGEGGNFKRCGQRVYLKKELLSAGRCWLTLGFQLLR